VKIYSAAAVPQLQPPATELLSNTFLLPGCLRAGKCSETRAPRAAVAADD